MGECIVVGVGSARVAHQSIHEVRTVLRNLFRIQVHGERCQSLASYQGGGGRVAVQHQVEFIDLDDALSSVRAFNVNAQGGFFNHPDVTC